MMRRTSARGGFSLLELTVAISIFAVVGYSAVAAVEVSHDAQRTVARVVGESRSLRSSCSSLIEDLRATSDSRITVTSLADGNHQVDLLQPIEVGGVLTWGVYERGTGSDESEWTHANWRVRYTVTTGVGASGATTRRLVRRILDEALLVQREEVLIEGLRDGREEAAGLRVVQSGDVWEITLSTEDDTHESRGTTNRFHVRTRN